MKIREIVYDHTVEVFCVYWKNGMRHVLVIPYEGYEGFNAIPENKCEVTDHNVDNFVLWRTQSGEDMLIHKAAFQDNLLYKLINHQPEAMAEFLRRLETYRPPSEDHGSESCPCCNRRTLNSSGCYETCLVCGWIDDPIQSEDPDYPAGENTLSLNDARRHYLGGR